MKEAATVFVVDDDASVLKSLKRLISSVGYEVGAFASAQEFLQESRHDGPCCLVLDVRMPGLSGLELQEQMTEAGLQMPIIFITGHGNVSMSVRAMKAGAVDFLEKPYDEQTLLEAVRAAVDRDRTAKLLEQEVREIQQRVQSLTPREQEVFGLIITGMLNKQIAYELGAAEKTIKTHRARVMRKMKAESVADLVRLAEKAGFPPKKSNPRGTKVP